MNLYGDSLDDAILDEKISAIDPDMITESIQKQIDQPFEVFSKKNYLNKFLTSLKNATAHDGMDAVMFNQRDIVLYDIKRMIEKKYDIDIYVEEDNDLVPMVKHFYKFFVLEMSENLSKFFEMYIKENQKEVAKFIKREKQNSVTDIVSKNMLIGAGEDMVLIISNMITAVMSIANSNLTFEDFLDTLSNHPDVSASVEMIKEYNLMHIGDDNNNLYETIMQFIIDRENGYSKIVSNTLSKLYDSYNTPSLY